MIEHEEPKIKSVDDLRNHLKSTGSNLEGTTFRETTIRVGLNDTCVIEVEKADGETFFHLLETEEG